MALHAIRPHLERQTNWHLVQRTQSTLPPQGVLCALDGPWDACSRSLSLSWRAQVTNNGVTLPAVPVSATGAYSVTTAAPAAPGLDVITATFIPSQGSSFQPSPTAQVRCRPPGYLKFVEASIAGSLRHSLATLVGHACYVTADSTQVSLPGARTPMLNLYQNTVVDCGL